MPSPRSASSRSVPLLQSLGQRIERLRADRPVVLSLLLFAGFGSLVGVISWDYWTGDPDFLSNVIAEFHGTLMDLLLFGCLLLWLDQKAERHRRIRRYRDAIEDFLGWESTEATHRIMGNVRRLNREGVTPESLKNAHLPGATLEEANLSDAALDGANFQGANLVHADLSGAYLGTASFANANLQEADLREAYFGDFLGRTTARDAGHTDLSGANLRGANLRGVRNATAETFAEAETLYKAQLDPALEADIEATYPHLIDLESSKGHE